MSSSAKNLRESYLKYSAEQVIAITGCTQSQLKDWCRKTKYREPLLEASFKSSGPPNKDYFSWSDLISFGLIRELVRFRMDRDWILVVLNHAKRGPVVAPYNRMFGIVEHCCREDVLDLVQRARKREGYFIEIVGYENCFSITLSLAGKIFGGPVSYFKFKGNKVDYFSNRWTVEENERFMKDREKEGRVFAINIDLMNLLIKLWSGAERY